MAYQAWSVVFGEQPSASKWNILGTNDLSFHDGTGIDDGVILSRHFGAGAVDAPARSEVVKSGTIAAATLGSTGNKAVTGVGFTPKLVIFTMKVPSYSTTSALQANGLMTADDQFYTAVAAGASFRRVGASNRCLGWVNVGSAGADLEASRVSLDADGFTINVNSVSTSAFDWNWLAIA